jgi:membrane protease subunit HflK
LARGDEEEVDDESIRRSVGRTLANWLTVAVSLAVIVGWGATGIYFLEPGESAVILFVGERSRTISEEGPHWHYPPPVETIEIVNASAVRQEGFGLRPSRPPAPTGPGRPDDATPVAGESTTTFENAMQTADNNIVNLGYVLKYEIDDAFAYLYGMADPEKTLFDATRSAVREVVGQLSIDEVLYTSRQEIEVRAREELNTRLAEYFGEIEAGSAFRVRSVELQVVQPPAQVQEAFDEIIAAGQDEERSISQARGDAKETLEKANGKAIELEQSSLAYKESKVLEATGRASRFDALLVEYKLAPEVTRRRLYLETMEEILPQVDKMVIEPGSASVVPFLPMGQGVLPVPPKRELDPGEVEGEEQ